MNSKVDLDKVAGQRDQNFRVDHKHKSQIRESIPIPELDPRKLFSVPLAQ